MLSSIESRFKALEYLLLRQGICPPLYMASDAARRPLCGHNDGGPAPRPGPGHCSPPPMTGKHSTRVCGATFVCVRANVSACGANCASFPSSTLMKEGGRHTSREPITGELFGFMPGVFTLVRLLQVAKGSFFKKNKESAETRCPIHPLAFSATA